jgi:hypothetical protein
MTLQNKNWLKNEIFRLYLSGDSQENVANTLKISVGTVNNFVSEIIKSDDTVDLQRQIAIVAKKNGVDIKQIAANLRWKNKIKQWSLDDKKIEKFLDVMNMLFNKYTIPPATAANRLCSIIEIMQRDNIEPDKLEEEIKSKNVELETINAQIEARLKHLEKTKTKVENKQTELRIEYKDLDQFHQLSQLLELYDYPEISTEYGMVTRAIINFKRLGYDPKAIVTLFGKSENLIETIEKLEIKLQEMEDVLESYRRRKSEEESRWKEHDNAFEKFKGLIKDGLKVEDIFTVVHVLKNDFPNMDVPQIIKEIKTLGSIEAVRLKRQRILEIANGWLLYSG